MTSTSPIKQNLLRLAIVAGALVLAAFLLRGLWLDSPQAPDEVEEVENALSGRVLSEDGQPLAGATVVAGTLEVLSDERERFALPTKILRSATKDVLILDATHPEYVRGEVDKLKTVRLDVASTDPQDIESI